MRNARTPAGDAQSAGLDKDRNRNILEDAGKIDAQVLPVNCTGGGDRNDFS